MLHVKTLATCIAEQNSRKKLQSEVICPLASQRIKHLARDINAKSNINQALQKTLFSLMAKCINAFCNVTHHRCYAVVSCANEHVIFVVWDFSQQSIGCGIQNGHYTQLCYLTKILLVCQVFLFLQLILSSHSSMHHGRFSLQGQSSQFASFNAVQYFTITGNGHPIDLYVHDLSSPSTVFTTIPWYTYIQKLRNISLHLFKIRTSQS